MNGYPCPVCAYGRDVPVEEGDICECCGTEYGVDDFGLTENEIKVARRQLRWQWVQNGAPWFYTLKPPPPNWTA